MPPETGMPMNPRRQAMQEVLDEDQFGAKENPMGSEMNKLFIDKALFPPDVKEGDQVRILATVGPVGSKVTITPTEAEMVGAEAEQGDLPDGGGAPPENAVPPAPDELPG